MRSFQVNIRTAQPAGSRLFRPWKIKADLLFAIVSALLMAMSGCFSTPQVQTPIHESRQGRILLKTFPDNAAPASHPAVLDVELLEKSLRGIHIREEKALLATLISGEAQQVPVFAESEVRFLTRSLMKALAQATSEEYVWFELINEKLSPPRTTSGVVYLDDDLLRFGLEDFRADSRYARLSSKASVSPTRSHQWTLQYQPAVAIRQDTESRNPFAIHAPIGSIAIDLRELRKQTLPQGNDMTTPAESESGFERQDHETGEIQSLQEEIQRLRRQLDGQSEKLRHLENRLQQNDPQ